MFGPPLRSRYLLSRIALALATGAVACVPVADHEDPDPPPIGTGGTGGGTGGTTGGRGGTAGFSTGGSGVGGRGGSGVVPPQVGSFLARPAVSAAAAPPALSGGTLLVLADGRTAFAADPDRDRLYFADLDGERLLSELKLEPGDEPGRAVEDAAGGVHVVLRRGGAVVSVAADRTLRERRPVCPAPRGIAFDRAAGLLHVACAGGELVTLPAAGGAITRTVHLDRDLRDVVKVGDQLFVSRFKTGQLLVVSADGRLFERRALPGSDPARQLIITSMTNSMPAALPSVAWRMRALADGSAAVLHQESTNSELGTQPGGYGGGPCKSPMAAAVTQFGSAPSSAKTGAQIAMAVLPIDFAESRDGKRRAMVLAGNANGGSGLGMPQVTLTPGSGAGGVPGAVSAAANSPASGARPPDIGCTTPVPQPTDPEPIEFRQPVGDAVAVDFDGLGRVVVQTREPARLEIISHRGGTIKLADESRFDSGHAVFHLATRNGLACASCHPEGGDDGRMWDFETIGRRRTQNLQGGLAMTAPFHWDGDMRDLNHLMTDVFSGRMGGPSVTPDHVQALSGWMNRLPLPGKAPARDSAAVERGRTLFNDPVVACATCHSGPAFTNNATVAVGTGKPFQVPSLLGLPNRAPYMHDGCAQTLEQRFSATQCGGGDQHGKTSHLTPLQINELIAYLETL